MKLFFFVFFNKQRQYLHSVYQCLIQDFFVGTWGELSSITCVYEFVSREIGLDCKEDKKISASYKGLILSSS